MQKRNDSKEKQFEELVIDVKSVVKVNKGGRQRRYSAIVVVGDRKGKVGLGIGKANEVPDAIKKAIQDANKNLITIIPTKKLNNTPIKNASVNSKSFILTSTAANTIGVDNKNVYFAAASLVTPIALAVVIVIPERDTPGINAKA